jgi:hypothetical protein
MSYGKHVADFLPAKEAARHHFQHPLTTTANFPCLAFFPVFFFLLDWHLLKKEPLVFSGMDAVL